MDRIIPDQLQIPLEAGFVVLKHGIKELGSTILQKLQLYLLPGFFLRYVTSIMDAERPCKPAN
jgi:hypothetical protein